MINVFNSYIDTGQPSQAADSLVKAIQNVCRRVKFSKRKTNSKAFWDEDLELARQHKHRCFRVLKQENSLYARNCYRAALKTFKDLMRSKENEHKLKLKNRLSEAKNINELWNIVKAGKKQKTCVNSISSDDWLKYFEKLLNTTNPLEEQHQEEVRNYMDWHDKECLDCRQENNDILDKPITVQEINNEIDNLPSKKSPGIDGIVNEILRNARCVLGPLLCRLFNCILEKRRVSR